MCIVTQLIVAAVGKILELERREQDFENKPPVQTLPSSPSCSAIEKCCIHTHVVDLDIR